MQLQRVIEASDRHRFHHSPNEQERREDPDAEARLHADVYFLALAIRRVLLFHDLLSRHVTDERLARARDKFHKAAPKAKELRDLYEHLDEYLLDSPRKHIKLPGRAAPVLLCRWDCSNVVVRFGAREIDVTLAAHAAIELGRISATVWDENLEQAKSRNSTSDPPPTDDGIDRMLTAKLGISTIIGGRDEGFVQHTGTLLDVDVCEGKPHEA